MLVSAFGIIEENSTGSFYHRKQSRGVWRRIRGRLRSWVQWQPRWEAAVRLLGLIVKLGQWRSPFLWEKREMANSAFAPVQRREREREREFLAFQLPAALSRPAGMALGLVAGCQWPEFTVAGFKSKFEFFSPTVPLTVLAKRGLLEFSKIYRPIQRNLSNEKNYSKLSKILFYYAQFKGIIKCV